ncbi:MAG: acetyl-CoA acetyltransferase [Eubacteriales bacterium]
MSDGEVAIIGMGCTRFTDHFNKSYGDLVVEAAFEAMDDAGVGLDDLQAAWLGTCYAYDYNIEGNAGSSLAEPLNLFPIPVSRVANYCATGIDAIRNAAFAVASGQYDLVLVVGVEKMRDVPPRGSLVAVHAERTHPVLAKGRTAPGMFGLMAQRYAHVYGDVKQYMAMVAVKNHYNGSLNPKAHFQKALTMEEVLAAPLAADHIGILDCTPTSDGAAAVILTRKSLAEKFTRDYVLIKGIGLAVTSGYFTAQFDQSWDFLGFSSTREAARQAYRQAGISDPGREIDVAEVHDCFTITEILNYEDLGFCERGGGTAFVAGGHSSLEGKLPVNTSGGLQACGHPIGASGVRMVVDVGSQLLGRAGKRQVKGNPATGLAHALGGPGSVAAVAVLGLPVKGGRK